MKKLSPLDLLFSTKDLLKTQNHGNEEEFCKFSNNKNEKHLIAALIDVDCLTRF